MVDEKDRKRFEATLEEVVELGGWGLFAWVLMSGHYDLVFKTPEANLVVGMSWFQAGMKPGPAGERRRKGYSARQDCDHGGKEAERIIAAAAHVFGPEGSDWAQLPKGVWRKG